MAGACRGLARGKGRTGKVSCFSCRGAGRVNGQGARVLPAGEWPEWCGACRGAGVVACARCGGDGRSKPRIGFRLPHQEGE